MRNQRIARRALASAPCTAASIVAATVLALVLLLLVGLRAARADTPPAGESLDWRTPVACMHDDTGRAVRVQCDPERLRCLVAADARDDGTPLRRTTWCASYAEDWATLTGAGYTMVPARAEAPPGWWRDERGRVSQISFDLLSRVVVGAAWAPRFQLGDALRPEADVAVDGAAVDLERVRFELGFIGSFLSSHETRHTLRAFQGTLALDDLAAHALLFDYELHHHSATPLLRLVTFFGEPRRYDVDLDLGFGVRLAEVRSEHRHDRAHTDLDFIAVRGGWDVLLSGALDSHLRLAAGLGWGALWSEVSREEAVHYLQPTGELEGRIILDAPGRHHLLGGVLYEGFALTDDALDDAWRQRLTLSSGYEWVFLSINDQPVSLDVELGAAWRDDLPGEGPLWDLTAITGLRFSLWAPAREAALEGL